MIPSTFKSIFDLINRFPTELSCHEWLASQRWGGYMVCPFEGCPGDQAYVYKDGIRYKCKCCKKNYTAKTGTIFEGTKLPLIKWIMAIYLIMHKSGISSVQLSQDIGVTQKTAWFLLQRIRHVLGHDKPNVQLEGIVQLDETFVGGKNKNRHHDKKVKQSQGRSFIDKTPVMGMLQTEEREYIERPHKVIRGRTVREKVVTKASFVKCFKVADTSADSLLPLIHQHVSTDSILVSDEWKAYNSLSERYKHAIVDHGRKQYVNEDGFTSNGIENFWRQFKNGITGIYHQISRKHMNKYVQEFVFKYNYRNLRIEQQINVAMQSIYCRLRYTELIQQPS